MRHTSVNNLVSTWCKLSPIITNNPTNIANWTNPNGLSNPLLNEISNQTDFSSLYLPEPYWGNTGLSNDELHSVVINYNPGIGGVIQHCTNSNSLFGFNNYQDFVQSEITMKTLHFAATTKWHSSNRAMRVLNTLKRIDALDNAQKYSLLNHLSIELIPWHASKIHQIGNYISLNLKTVFENCFLFAANEASRISNQKLKNVVLLRMNYKNISPLLNQFQEQNICNYHIVSNQTTPSGFASYLEFRIDSIPKIRFVCVSGKYTRNNFPDDLEMDWIFQNVI